MICLIKIGSQSYWQISDRAYLRTIPKWKEYLELARKMKSEGEADWRVGRGGEPNRLPAIRVNNKDYFNTHPKNGPSEKVRSFLHLLIYRSSSLKEDSKDWKQGGRANVEGQKSSEEKRKIRGSPSVKERGNLKR